MTPHGGFSTPCVLVFPPTTTWPIGQTYLRNPAETLCCFKNEHKKLNRTLRAARGAPKRVRMSSSTVDALLFHDFHHVTSQQVLEFFGAWPPHTWLSCLPSHLGQQWEAQVSQWSGVVPVGVRFAMCLCARILLSQVLLDELTAMSNSHVHTKAFHHCVQSGFTLACAHFRNMHLPLLEVLLTSGPPQPCDTEPGPTHAKDCVWVAPVTLLGVRPWYQGPGVCPPTIWSAPEVMSVVMYTKVNDPRARKRRNKSQGLGASEEDVDPVPVPRPLKQARVTTVDIEFGLDVVKGEKEGGKGADKHQKDKELQRWVDDKTPGSPFPVPVVLWDACCRVAGTNETGLKCSIGSVVADRLKTASANTTTNGMNEGIQGTINLLSHALFLGLTGGYPHVTDPKQVADASTTAQLWRATRGPCKHTVGAHCAVVKKWAKWLKSLSTTSTTKGGAGGPSKPRQRHSCELLVYCCLVEYVVAMTSMRPSCTPSVFVQPHWGPFPMVVLAAQAALRLALCRSHWTVTDPQSLSSFLGTAISAAARSSGFRMPMGVMNRQNHLDILLDTIIRLRTHGYVSGTNEKEAMVDPVKDAAATQAIFDACHVVLERTNANAMGVTVLAPQGVVRCCNQQFGFLRRQVVAQEFLGLKDYFVWPEGGKRVVRETTSDSLQKLGFEKPTPTALAKDAMNALDDGKGALSTIVYMFVCLGTGPEVVTAAWSVFMDLTCAAPQDVATRTTQAEAVLKYAAAQSSGVARTGSDTCGNPVSGVVKDLVARMNCDTLCALMFVCMARQRAEVVTYCEWDQSVVERGLKQLDAMHGPGVAQGAARVWVCFSCCVIYAVLVNPGSDTASKRTVLGAHEVCCDPCPRCCGCDALAQATCKLCHGIGVLATCAHQSPTDSRGGKPKRCVSQLFAFDLARGGLRVLDVAVALCVTCGCKFRWTSGCWSTFGPTCPLCLRFEERHGALPVPADVSLLASSWMACVPSARRDLPRTCCMCSVLVASTGGGFPLRVAQETGPDSVYNILMLCKAHAKAFMKGITNHEWEEGNCICIPSRVFTREEVVLILAAASVHIDMGMPPPTKPPPLWAEKFWFPGIHGLPRRDSRPDMVTPHLYTAIPAAMLSRFKAEVGDISRDHALALMLGESIKMPVAHP